MEINWQLMWFVLGVGVLTGAASFWDLRTRRIPNKLTIPALVLGLIYQAAFNGWGRPGLADAGLAFAFGFGTLFLLWLVGGGGGGDVKLIGALSVWLGFQMTVWVLAISTLFVLLGTMAVVASSFVTEGLTRTRKRSRSLEQDAADSDTEPASRRKRIMAFALPVALATWVVVLWKLPTISYNNGPNQLNSAYSNPAVDGVDQDKW